ncbi:MAG: histone deacetylase [Deltaproteobacteria bacterium]|nr:histone deacetylase [Deltaproteobacteria bacterium]
MNLHSRDGHSENPYRTDAGLRGILSEQKLDPELGIFKIERPMKLEADPMGLLSIAHKPAYIKSVKDISAAADFLSKSKWAPYGGGFAFPAAVLAAGLTTELANSIFLGTLQNGLALVRPPGHHAGSDFGGGYCLFNNTAVAAATIVKSHSAKVAIIDLDVHHGNGTEEIFYRDPNVLYISIHQEDWPFTGDAGKTGEGPGQGTNINIPLPHGAGDAQWARVFAEVALPALERFSPKMIFLSMGFDTHWRDPQGSMTLSSAGQAGLMQEVCSIANRLCDKKLCVVLEGGYQADVLETGIANCMRVLTNRVNGFADEFGQSPIPFNQFEKVDKVLKSVKSLHGLGS